MSSAKWITGFFAGIAGAIVFACSDSSGPGGAPRFVSVPSGDTAGAFMTSPVIIAAAPGAHVSLHSDSAAVVPGHIFPTAYFRSSPSAQIARMVDTLTMDSHGLASSYLVLGFVAKTITLTATVIETGISAHANLVISPGRPTSLAIVPNDTAVYVGRGYTLKAELRDRYGNGTPATATFATSASGITVTTAGTLTASAISRDTITAQGGGFSATGFVSVVPEARIAAMHQFAGGDDSSYIVLFNLDGTARRTFRMHTYDIGQAAWHPSGAYLIAARRTPGSDPLTKARLAAVDTATGTWRNIVGLNPVGGDDGYGEFSHDGQWIYVARENPDNANYHGTTVFRIRTDGSGSPEIVGYDSQNDYLGYNHPTVSRNDDLVAVTMNGFGAYRLIVPVSPGLGPSPPDNTVINNSATGTVWAWSPVSDSTIMFGNEGMWLMAHDKSTINDRVYIAQQYAEGAGTIGTGGFAGATWSPDGKWILARAGIGFILVEVATRRVIPVPIDKSLVNPAWRPR